MITAVNKIKAHPSNSRLSKQLCSENDKEFERLLLHTGVLWLSKGNCFAHLFILFTRVVNFLQTVDLFLAEQLAAIKLHVAYLADILVKFNNLNLQLQGDETNLVKFKSTVSGFIMKLPFYQRNIQYKVFSQFPILKELEECSSNDTLLFSQNISRASKLT
ncbi:protein ZBED8-like [Octopus bimaculoides]|uniref:protein ZBED8-like n=1 Tax=Octopus bimaculoides TaxID=37653 RepID=UPI00071DE023|nr:protein ZBED8-like [Octopus bimaculoides]|eukprot:XP_014778683.1 PREDICTED: protein ZBED8-like [Octopus bimaculoides]